MTSPLSTLYPEHTFSLLLTIEHQLFLLLDVNVGTMRVEDSLSLPIDSRRSFSSVAVDVVGIGVWVGDVGAGG